MRSMRSSIVLAAVAAFITLAYVGLTGCTSANPTVQSDAALVASDQKALAAASTQATTQPTLASLQSQLAADQASANASAVIADQAAIARATANAQALAALQAKVTADEAKEASDVAAVQTSEVQAGTQVAQTVASSIPSPWGPIASALISLAGIGVVAYFGHKSAAAAISAVATSVPASTLIAALPSNLQPVVTAGLQAADDIAKVATTTTTTTVAPAAQPTPPTVKT